MEHDNLVKNFVHQEVGYLFTFVVASSQKSLTYTIFYTRDEMLNAVNVELSPWDNPSSGVRPTMVL